MKLCHSSSVAINDIHKSKVDIREQLKVTLSWETEGTSCKIVTPSIVCHSLEIYVQTLSFSVCSFGKCYIE